MRSGLSFEDKRAFMDGSGPDGGGIDAGGSVRCSNARVEHGFPQSTYPVPRRWNGKAEETGIAIMIDARYRN